MSCNVWAAQIKGIHGIHPTTRFALTDQLVGRYTDIVERDATCIAATLTHIGLLFPKGEALCICFNNKSRHTSIAGIRICFGQDKKEISISSTSDPHLGTVDDVVITISNRCGLNGSNIGTSARFSDCVGCESTFFSDFSQPDVLLFLGCTCNDWSTC